MRATSAALSLKCSTARQQTIARAREILLCLLALLMICGFIDFQIMILARQSEEVV